MLAWRVRRGRGAPGGRRLGAVLAAAAGFAAAAPAPAYLFWNQPKLAGAPVTGDEPGVAVPLAGANPKEVRANLLWAMRAGLNVAALQCQFSPALMTVGNYNGLLRQHSTELKQAYDTLSTYFKRTGGKAWQTTLDQYTTRTYNSFSTLRAQLEFCETAASIGREALSIRPAPGGLTQLALDRMREFRNSQTQVGDLNFAIGPGSVAAAEVPTVGCVDKKGRPKPCRS